MRLMQFDIDLKWRKGEDHTAPDALSRLRRKGSSETPVDTAFPDDTTRAVDNQGLAGPMLDGVPLQILAPTADAANTAESPLDPGVDWCLDTDDHPVLDGVDLAALGTTQVHRRSDLSLTVFCALHLTPEQPEDDDHERLRTHEDVRIALAPRLPRAVILGCGAGGALLALQGLLQVEAAVEPDWTTLECA